MRDEVGLNLRDRIHRDADDDQEAGAAEIEGDAVLGNQDLGQDADEGQIDGADDREAREDVVQIVRGVLSRSYARNEPTVLAQIIRRLLRVEQDRKSTRLNSSH